MSQQLLLAADGGTIQKVNDLNFTNHDDDLIVVGDVDAVAPQLRRELGARPRGHVRDEPQPVAVLPETAHGARRARERLTGHVEHPVDVEQDRRHRRRLDGAEQERRCRLCRRRERA